LVIVNRNVILLKDITFLYRLTRKKKNVFDKQDRFLY